MSEALASVAAAACQEKIAYFARSTAERALKRMTERKRKLRAPHGNGKLKVYRCSVCDRFHLGHHG